MTRDFRKRAGRRVVGPCGIHEGFWYAVGAGITRPRAHDMRPYKGKEGSRPVCKGDAKKHSRPTGGCVAKLGSLLQVEESLHARILGHVAQFPIACDARNGDPDDLKCSGEVNSPCAKVFACGENACTRLPAPPLRRHKVRSAPFLPAAKTSLRSLAPPPPRRPTALGSSGAPQDGAPRSWATEKAKPPGRAALLQN